MQRRNLGKRNPLLATFIDNWFYVLVVIFLWKFPELVAEWSGGEVDSIRGESSVWQREMTTIFSLMMLAISYNLMFGFTGLISFGHAVFFGMGAYIVAILTSQYEFTFMESMVGALAFSTLISLVWSVAAFRLKGVYFAVFTLAFAEIFLYIAQLSALNWLTGGEEGVRWTPPDWLNPVRERLTIYNAALITLVVIFLIVRRLMNSPAGRTLIAMRDNEPRAETLGFNVHLHKMLSIILSGWIATIAGIFFALSPNSLRNVNTGSLELTRTVDALLYTLIGGIGTMPGPVVGTALLEVGEIFVRKPELQVDLRFIIGRITFMVDGEEYWPVLLGAAFVLFVLFVPYGIVGESNKIWLQVRVWLRRYIYNPLVYRYPQLATAGYYLTGEPPELAIAVAQKNPNPDILGWLREYPNAAMNTFTIIFAFAIGALTWEWRTGVEWFLFWVVISLPVRAILLGQLIYQRYRQFCQQHQQTESTE